MAKKYNRDMPLPSSEPMFKGPKPISKMQAYRVTEAAEKSNKKLKAQNKAAKKQKFKNTMLKVGTGIGVAGKVIYDAYHRGIQNDYTSTYKNAGGANYMPYGDSPSNKELRKWKKSRK